MMKERDIMEYLLHELYIHMEEEGNELDIERADSFDSFGIMANEQGFVITTNDGSEYQIFIVKNR